MTSDASTSFCAELQMGWFRPTLARRAPARASECWSAATVDTIYATAPPLGAFLRQTYRNLLGHQLQQKTHMPRLSSCDGMPLTM